MTKPLDGRQILWVEDRFDTLAQERTALENAGARLTLALTINHAFEHLQLVEFDLVILDVLLPQPDSPPEELAIIGKEIGLGPRSETLGLVLAVWLRRKKTNIRYLFYTVIPDAADPVLRRLVDPNNNLILDKTDQNNWFDKFVQRVLERLS